LSDRPSVRLSVRLSNVYIKRVICDKTKERYDQIISERERVRYMSSPVRLSVVCNVRAPYSSDENFRQCFYAIWYLDHLRPFGKNFTEIVPGTTPSGELNTRWVAEYSDFKDVFETVSRLQSSTCTPGAAPNVYSSTPTSQNYCGSVQRRSCVGCHLTTIAST